MKPKRAWNFYTFVGRNLLGVAGSSGIYIGRLEAIDVCDSEKQCLADGM